MKPLHGLQIVITRPEAQALKWQQQLHELGAETYLLPVMEICPLADKQQQHKIERFTKNLNGYQKIIFISQNAVAFVQHHIPPLAAQVDSNTKVYAIGSATAKALTDWGIAVEIANDTMNSEALLQSPDLQSIEGQSIAICRGLGGRETLADTLKKRGASVDYIELYQRRPHPQAKIALSGLSGLVEQRGQNLAKSILLSAHSGDSVKWLAELLQAEGKADIMKAWPILVPGQRVSQLAQEHGFAKTVVAVNASDAQMSQTVQDWWAQARD